MEADKEIWKDIEGYEELYKVSSYGITIDNYSGYLLFPTHNENKYFCLYYYQ